MGWAGVGVELSNMRQWVGLRVGVELSNVRQWVGLRVGVELSNVRQWVTMGWVEGWCRAE